MTVIQKTYFVISSNVFQPYDPFSPTPPSPPSHPDFIKDPICSEKLPNWFVNSEKKYKKITLSLSSLFLERVKRMKNALAILLKIRVEWYQIHKLKWYQIQKVQPKWLYQITKIPKLHS